MTRITAIVLSFNRPRMLSEALASLREARPDEVLVVDDGSDFDVPEVVRASFPAAGFVLAPPLTIEERLTTPRLGRLINAALGIASGDVIGYLCDDDLFDAGWLDRLRDFYARHPATPLVRGGWLSFREGEPPAPDCPPCDLDERQMTTGNFAHRRDCPGARWNPHTVSSHDDMFLWGLQRAGVDLYRVPHVGLAGYRRLHRHNALNFTTGHGYTAEARAVFAGGWLE